MKCRLMHAAFHRVCTICKDKNNLQGQKYQNLGILTCNPFKYKMDKSMPFVSVCMGNPSLSSIKLRTLLTQSKLDIMFNLTSGHSSFN